MDDNSSGEVGQVKCGKLSFEEFLYPIRFFLITFLFGHFLSYPCRNYGKEDISGVKWWDCGKKGKMWFTGFLVVGSGLEGGVYDARGCR